MLVFPMEITLYVRLPLGLRPPYEAPTCWFFPMEITLYVPLALGLRPLMEPA